MFQNRKEMEEKMRKEGRLPPGQALTDRFPVLHYGPIPPFNEASWNFRIWGEVEKPLKFSWAEFTQLPRTSMAYDLHCVTRWSKFDTQWEGVTVHSLIDAGLLKLKPSARFVMQRAEYDFSSNLPLEIVLSERFILATHFNGHPLTPEHGYPLRGVVGALPGQKSDQDVYFWKGAKWLRGLEFTTEDHKGFWEMAGYHNNANVWKEERLG
ncbi:MAG: molybdopterin-dependent oxidoreductase [Pelolinea sp.]|nr:molybdopterin-dependent oxidoreductase [Pelolinea sp.]